jgi:hypothetical protein
VGGLRGVEHPNDLQLDARRQDVEEPAAAVLAALAEAATSAVSA